MSSGTPTALDASALLALGSELRLRVLATDRVWSDLNLGIEIERIR